MVATIFEFLKTMLGSNIVLSILIPTALYALEHIAKKLKAKTDEIYQSYAPASA